MTKKEVIDLLYKAIDFINGNDKPEITPDSYCYVVPLKRESGFSNKYYIHVDKQADGGFWYCSMINVDLDKGTISLSKDCIYQDEWLQSLFKASKVTEIDKETFPVVWERAEDILNQMAEL